MPTATAAALRLFTTVDVDDTSVVLTPPTPPPTTDDNVDVMESTTDRCDDVGDDKRLSTIGNWLLLLAVLMVMSCGETVLLEMDWDVGAGGGCGC